MAFLFCAGVKDRSAAGFSRHIGTSRCRKPERAARRQGHDAHADAPASVPASVLLQQLHDEAPKDHFSLGWLMSRMHKRSFGLIMLLLAGIAIAPGVSIVAGLLLMIPTLQMIAGQNMPVFPSRIRRPSDADATPCSLGAASSTRAQVSRETHSSALATRADATKRVVGAIVAVLSISFSDHSCPFLQRRPRRCDRANLAHQRGTDSCSRLRCWPASLCWRSMAVLGHDPRREIDLRPLVLARPGADALPGGIARL